MSDTMFNRKQRPPKVLIVPLAHWAEMLAHLGAQPATDEQRAAKGPTYLGSCLCVDIYADTPVEPTHYTTR